MSLFIVGMYNPHYASLQRFEKLCRCILSSMEAENEPKVSGVGRGVPKSLPPPHKPACLALKVPLECAVKLNGDLFFNGYKVTQDE